MIQTRTANPVDRHVGQRLRQRRLLLGMTQEQLADKVGVSFQMIQKYEKGSCRVGASRLMQIAGALKVTPSFFFDEAPAAEVRKVAEDHVTMDADVMNKKETIDLLKAYYSLSDDVRRHVLAMVKSLHEKDAA